MARQAATTFSGLLKKEKTQQVNFRVTEGLLGELEQLDKRLATEAPDQQFDRSLVVEKALRDAVRAANAQLDKLSSGNGRA